MDLAAVGKLITQEQIEKYAAASGDFNPIHVDREFAEGSQFGGTIAHGMMIAASISEMMTMTFEEAWARTGRLKIRFRAPVHPGETITTFGRVQKIEARGDGKEIGCSVGVRKQSGEDVITGEAAVTVS